jgi:hypothetical protein
MALIPDSALPLCTNPQHPPALPRRMIYLQTAANSHVFACQACRDVNRKLSVRVVTDQFYRREVRRQLAAQNRLPTGLLRPRPRSPHELDRMRELQAEAARQRALANRIDWDFSGAGKPHSRDGKYEVVEYRNLGNGAVQIQMAINGYLCPQMDDHLASREEFRTEEQYWSRVARGSELMLHLYGDPRYPLTPEESAQREQETF